MGFAVEQKDTLAFLRSVGPLTAVDDTTIALQNSRDVTFRLEEVALVDMAVVPFLCKESTRETTRIK